VYRENGFFYPVLLEGQLETLGLEIPIFRPPLIARLQ
jgi:hypothetical protein